MKKILLIEDAGYMKDRLKERLEGTRRYTVFDAYSLPTAKDIWDSEGGKFDCIILDLLLPQHGIPSDEYAAIYPLIGMKALDYFYKTEENSEETINKKTIIFSGFTADIKGSKYEANEYFEIIQKGSDGNSIEMVMNAVNNLLN